MVNILTFKAIRPPRDKAQVTSTKPYNSYKKKHVQAKMKYNPYTFLHIINPEFSSSGDIHSTTANKIADVKNKFKDFREKDFFIEEDKPSLYVYRQSCGSISYTGIIALASVADYMENKIKIHEQTLIERERKFKQYIDICEYNTEPVLLAYENNDELPPLLNKVTNRRQEYDFTTTDTIRHELWVIDDSNEINRFTEAFQRLSHVYIADGHHRSASSALLAQERRLTNTSSNETSPCDYFMAYFIPDTELRILDFNRLVSDLNGLTKDQFLGELITYFHIIKKQEEEIKPSSIHLFSMYLDGLWYLLEPIQKPTLDNSLLQQLDASILNSSIFDKVLGISNLRNNSRVQFLGGNEGLTPLQKKVDSGKMAVAFVLYPVSTSMLKEIADGGLLMPPKTTYIEPKLRSGLTIYNLEKNNSKH